MIVHHFAIHPGNYSIGPLSLRGLGRTSFLDRLPRGLVSSIGIPASTKGLLHLLNNGLDSPLLFLLVQFTENAIESFSRRPVEIVRDFLQMELQWHHPRIGQLFIKVSRKLVLRLCMGPSTRVPEISAALLLFHFLLIVLNRPFNFLSPHGLQPLKHRVIAAGILSLSLLHISGGADASRRLEPVLRQDFDIFFIL